MNRSKNFPVKVCGLLLSVAALACWMMAKTPNRVQAQFSGQANLSLAASLPAASSVAAPVQAGTQTFCGGGITFNNVPPPATSPFVSTPYPSTISVSGMTGTVTSVTVALNGLNHTFPDDIDLLLVGPTGVKTIIMADVGGNPDAVNLNITLDDAALTSLPDTGPLVSGTFKPTNPPLSPVDVFPAPAPAGPYASALAAFNVTNPNGNWNLYAVDDQLGDVGSIASWCLTITTANTAPCVLTCPADVTVQSDANQCGAASVTYPPPTTSGVCGAIECSPPSGSFFFVGTTTVTCTSATGDSCSFNVTVNPVSCPDTEFCNATSISLQTNSVTSPYPSSIGVSGLSGTVSKVTVTLKDITHTFPDDIDVLLVGPTGANAIIMSDAGGGTDINNVTLVFDDAAASFLPDASVLTSGTFKPTNNAPVETFAPPAPTPSGASALSVFNGTNPNGVWKLYVIDDSIGDLGSIAGGWCLTIERENACEITCPANLVVSNDLNACGAAVNYPAATTTGTCGAVTCSQASGSFFPVGTTTVTCTAAGGPSCSFTVTVNDTQNPTVTCPANKSLSADANCTASTTYTAVAADNCPGVGSPSCSPPSGSSFPLGTTTVTCTATDASGNQGNCSFTVTVVDTTPPVITCPANITIDDNVQGACGALLNPGTATAVDNCGSASVVGVRGDSLALNALYPVGTTIITWTATDNSGNTASCQQIIVVNNPSPSVTITGPASGSIFPVNTSVSFTSTFTDNLGDLHTAQWSFDAITASATVVEPTSSTPGTANVNFTFTTPGVYLVSLKVTDECGNMTTVNTVNGEPAMVVIFDPEGEFVTGGGWINSPAGAYPANPTLTGKANFGFNCKYHNGQATPQGETQFKFASFNFHSTSYDWLVIEGPRFQFKGSGKVNNSGNYGFLLTGIDGSVSGGGGTDKFRIKIWDKNNGNAVVYDNEIGNPDSANPTTVLGGGNLVIHH